MLYYNFMLQVVIKNMRRYQLVHMASHTAGPNGFCLSHPSLLSCPCKRTIKLLPRGAQPPCHAWAAACFQCCSFSQQGHCSYYQLIYVCECVYERRGVYVMLLEKRQQERRTKRGRKNKILQTNHRNKVFLCNTFCSCVRGTVWLVIFFFFVFFSLLLVWNQFIFSHMATIPQATTGLRLGSRDPYAFSRDDALSDV